MSIENYDWFDGAVLSCTNIVDETCIAMNAKGGGHFLIEKVDEIALAKHFKLTSEELKSD